MNFIKKNGIWPALGVWSAGLVTVMIIDYVVRLNSDDYYTLGIGENLWFVSHTLFGLLAAGFLLFSLKHKETAQQIKGTLTASLSGALIYLVIVYSYIIGTGLDSL